MLVLLVIAFVFSVSSSARRKFTRLWL